MENIGNQSKDKLISFFQHLICSIEQDKLSDKQYIAISEFYTCFKFKEKKEHFSPEDYLKFLSLGWYIYSQIESNQ